MVKVFNVGGWLTHGDLVLDTEVDFLAVVEHRLIPAKVRSEWAGKGWPLSGRQLLRILPMLVMLGLGLLVLGVLQSLCLPLVEPTKIPWPVLLVGRLVLSVSARGFLLVGPGEAS